MDLKDLLAIFFESMKRSISLEELKQIEIEKVEEKCGRNNTDKESLEK